MSETVGSERVGSEVGRREKVGSEVVRSEKVGSERVGSERVGSEKVGNERVGSERVGSEVVGSEDDDEPLSVVKKPDCSSLPLRVQSHNTILKESFKTQCMVQQVQTTKTHNYKELCR